jgi:hypothetical protein
VTQQPLRWLVRRPDGFHSDAWSVVCSHGPEHATAIAEALTGSLAPASLAPGMPASRLHLRELLMHADHPDQLAAIDELDPAQTRGQIKAAMTRVRDEAYREARALFPGKKRAPAESLEKALTAYRRGGWSREFNIASLPAHVDPLHRLLHRILRNSVDGEPLGWRRIVDL